MDMVKIKSHCVFPFFWHLLWDSSIVGKVKRTRFWIVCHLVINLRIRLYYTLEFLINVVLYINVSPLRLGAIGLQPQEVLRGGISQESDSIPQYVLTSLMVLLYFVKTNKQTTSKQECSPCQIFLKLINVALHLLGTLEFFLFPIE